MLSIGTIRERGCFSPNISSEIAAKNASGWDRYLIVSKSWFCAVDSIFSVP